MGNMKKTADISLAKRHVVTATRASQSFGMQVDRCLRGHSVMITRNGRPSAIMVPIDQWDRLQAAAGEARA